MPGRQLAARGHTVTMPPYKEQTMPDGRLGIEYSINLHPPLPMADIWVLQQRKERMWPDGGIMALRNHGIVTVAECDDNYLEVPAYNPAFFGTHPYRGNDGRIKNREERRRIAKATGVKAYASVPNKHNRDHLHKGFEMVDAVTVSTPYLKEVYSRFNPNIQVIRNYLDWEMWEDVTPQYEVERERLRIGYMGVFGFRRGDLDIIKGVVRPFLLKHKDIDFVASSEEVHDYLDVPKEQRITTGEVAFREMNLASITAVMDVGLVPLVMNGLNQGKSHLKGMEYNACGIPFIASPTESYKEYWCDGNNGFLASNASEWNLHLESLVRDADTRQAMARHGRAKAEQHTIQNHVGEWESFYLGLLGGDEHTLARQTLLRGAIQKTGELAGLIQILKGRKLQTIVEIGSARGGTFWTWAQIADPDALLVSIDLPGADFSAPELAGASPERIEEYVEVVQRKMRSYAREQQQVELIRGDSHSEEVVGSLRQIIGGREIDFLFIDGDHSYEGCKADYDLYSPLVADNGVIAFHDIIGRPRQPTCRVPEVWSELRNKNRCVELYDSTSWGYGRWGGIGVVYKEESRVRAA